LEKFPWYERSVGEISADLGVNPEKGLSSNEITARREKYGSNELEHRKGPGVLQMFFAQMKDAMVIILVIASVLSILVKEVADALIIIGIVIVNAILGVVQEYRAGKAMEALQKMSAPNAKVIRDGKEAAVPSADLVPGDLVVLETGDYIPADIRLTSTINLKVEEAALTGESVPVEKDAKAELKGDIGLGDQVNSGFMSTLVTYGRGRGIVTATGMDTVIGGIAQMIQEEKQEDTPLQKKLAQLGKFLGIACLSISAVVFILGLIRKQEPLTMFMTAVSLAVAAIPEGMPAVVTIVLAMGMQRMANRNSIMKKLHAVETLGSTSVICSDKTGTLTQNQMTIVKMYTQGQEIEVSGDGYKPEGIISIGGKEVNLSEQPTVARLIEILALCNDARLEHVTDGEIDEWRVIGDPTEGAMVVAAAKAGIQVDEINRNQPRLQEIPFDSQRKLMTTFHQTRDGQLSAFTKGAPDILIERCTHIMRSDGTIDPIKEEDIKDIMDENISLASQAYRVLAMAYKIVAEIPEHPSSEEEEQSLIFTGLVGMIDPPRAEAIEAIKVCKSAGIRAVMITGDYRETAAAIARQLGIISSDEEVLTGTELNQMDDQQLNEAVKTVSVFARVSPEHKVRIVQAMKSNSKITAMTGDGVNDAPALKRADIGVAMGITGTDVTKESADMIITDDNFSSIVSAVEEGRVVYSNIRKFVYFLLSCNVGEVLIIFIAMLLGWNVPLLPIHILWVNLLTDSFPALALGTEKKEPGLMDIPPRDPDESILNRDMIVSIAVQSVVMTAAVLTAFFYGWQNFGIEMGRTYALVTLILSELLRAYSARSEKYPIWNIGLFTNRNMNYATAVSLGLLVMIMFIPALRGIFNIELFKLSDWITAIALALFPLIFGELTKVFRNRFKRDVA
jgi:Ca2+-transporting ATPase